LTTVPPPAAGAELATPPSAAALFRVFTRMALQGFGGVLPIAQRELVERERWMTGEDFVETLALAQVLPGPNVVNLALMFGDRHFGLRGALAAGGGLLLLPLALVLGLAVAYSSLSHLAPVAGALRGMGAVAAGLVIATALKLMPALRRSPLGLPLSAGLVAATVLTVGLWRWPLLGVLLGLGGLSLGLAWRRLRR
jgi:chromate transporter